MDDAPFLAAALALAREALDDDEGGPFGAVLARDGAVVGRGRNRVLARADPTAHAEMEAIRDAARALGSHDLSGCTAYVTCEPCPMCQAALAWARVDEVVYAAGRDDAAALGFDDARLWAAMAAGPEARRPPLRRVDATAAVELMRAWGARPDRHLY